MSHVPEAYSATRYDEVADFYVNRVREWGDNLGVLDLIELSGARVLDLACGDGRISRLAAQRGATVIGVDISRELIRRGEEAERADPLGIRYVVGDVCAGSAWWAEDRFDAAFSNMALTDMGDIDAAFATVRTVLRPGGPFAFVILHPCFPGPPDLARSWPIDGGYYDERWWTTRGAGVRGHVGAYHRTVSTYLNAVINAGFRIERIGEPWPGQAPPESSPPPSVPVFLAVLATLPD